MEEQERPNGRLAVLRERAAVLRRALADPRTPWYARAIGLAALAYAVSPIDLIPDFIPVIGQLDDLVIVPAGIALAWRLIPDDVKADAKH